MTNLTPNEKLGWQDALSNLITDPEELFEILQLKTADLEKAKAASKAFPLKVTHSYVSRMQKGNWSDPLLMQVLPLGLELEEVAGYVTDPLEEEKANCLPGLLHKYQGRVLITLTSACAIHCRYCFRRHFPYSDNNPGRAGWQKWLDYIASDTSIHEIILSGGDPLAVSDKLLTLFSDAFASLSHIKRLRIHTRLPIVLPQRIDTNFLTWVKQLNWDVVMVIHANHPQEIDAEVKAALQSLREAGVTLLNQSVLLKGINDSVETLKSLSESLFEAGVLPYYLHVLDKVQGAEHFDLPIEKAHALHGALCGVLPGYLVPRLAKEEAGKPSKTLLSTNLYTG